MTRIPVAISALLAILVAALVFANEPLWTEDERAANSTAVFEGRVVSVTRIEVLNDREDLFRAVIAVEAVFKGKELVGKNQFAVYFERPKHGDTGKRCPTYVELKQGRRAKFFVRLRTMDGEERAFLEMGSSVTEATREASPILSSGASHDNSPAAIEAATQQGAAIAAKDITTGKLRILYYGKPLRLDLFPTDAATGYPVQVIAGCMVSGTFVAETDAYNLAMREWFRKQETADQSKDK